MSSMCRTISRRIRGVRPAKHGHFLGRIPQSRIKRLNIKKKETDNG